MADSHPADLTRAERRIFTAVASAVVNAPAGEEVADAALPFLRRMPGADRRQLSLLLHVLEYGAPLTNRRLRRFTRLGRQERQAALRGWVESRLALRRQGAAALKALSAFAYYGRDAAGSEVGYDGRWLGRVSVPVLPAPSLFAAPAPKRASDIGRGITRGRTLRRDPRINTQVCVIGSGAGGAAAAARLAERGVDVVLVEAGGHPTAADFTQRELEMLPMLYQEAGLRATADKAVGILQGRGVGGSTLHNTGLVVPPPAAIMERWRQGHGMPWNQQALDGYVAGVLETLRAVPIPADRINPNNTVLKRGADALGWRHRVPLHNRESCSACGYCMLGCAYNRKYNAALSYLPRAVAHGARILSDAPAESIRGGPGARRVLCRLTGADGRPTGHRAEIEAATVLVAAGALDTPALLLRSGLGNGRVGRGLRLHPSPLVAGTMPEPIHGWRGLPQSVLIEEFASFLDDGYGGFLMLALAGWPGLSAALVPTLGAEHRRAMRSYPNAASAAVLLHDEGAGRVSIGRDGRPLARYWLNDADMREMQRGIHALARLYLAAGAEEVRLPHAGARPVRSERELKAAMAGSRPIPHRITLNSVHPQGSCPLGSNRADSAVTPHGELWGEPGLYVADASLFPTSVGVPPQVATMALATAVADRVAEQVR